ncbi:MAG: ATP-binding cassette domain-containing protein [Dehalococcoidia bacterium]|nr:ATP-binding cassette domain-containing protein [Dehalococcoidia bacterium]
MLNAIAASNLVKTFGATRALDHFDLAVEAGEVHGFLGPNGAGKSTTIRILLGLLRCDDGDVSLFGGDPWRDAVALHRRLAYVPDDVRLWENLSGGEVIDLLGRLRGGLDARRRAELIERYQLDPTKKCGIYSKGNRQKVALVAAFASDVELYIMDEPTGGLDPLMVSVFRDCVREARAAGRTVLLSSHVFADVEALCDRISIIRDGRNVESGALSDLRHLARTAITVETERPLTGLESLPGVRIIALDRQRAELQVQPDELDRVLRHLTGFGVRALTSAPPSLEEMFMRHYDTSGEASANAARAPQDEAVAG